MKTLKYILPLCLFFCFRMEAQIVGLNSFLQSGYVEVGINEGGVYASSDPEPESYHTTPEYATITTIDSTHIDTIFIDSAATYFDEDCSCWLDTIYTFTTYELIEFSHIDTIDSLDLPLGIIFDSDMDGWDVGSPRKYWGDVVTPGSPMEGFGIEMNGESYYNEGQFLTVHHIGGSFSGWDDSGDTSRSTWEGAIAGEHMSVIQKTLLPDNKLYFITEVTLTNTGEDTLSNVYYVRYLDPDQEFFTGGLPETNIIIMYNNPLDDEALVSSEGTIYGNSFVLMGSRDDRARVSFGGFEMFGRDVSDPWNEEPPYHQSGGGVSDVTIQTSFYIGDLFPLESATFRFSYIFSNDEAVIEEALESTLLCIAGYDITATDITNNAAVISWSTATPSIEYKVEWKETGTSVWNPSTTGENTFVLSGLDSCTEYEYRITSLCDTEVSSDIYTFETSCTDAIEEHELSLSLYPNPANDVCTIALKSTIHSPVEIVISDAIGNIIEEREINYNTSALTFSLENIPAGIYTVHITQGENESYRQLVVMK